MNTLEEIYRGRVEVYSPFTGKLVRIEGVEDYIDIFGIHLGCFQNTKWDRAGEYVFHSILSCEGVIRRYCIGKREVIEKIIQVIS